MSGLSGPGSDDPLPPPLHPGPGPAGQHRGVRVPGPHIPDVLLGVVGLALMSPEDCIN